MSAKTNAEVVIDGKVYTLSGYENEEYLQKVAAYINNKIAEFDDMDEYKHLPGNMKSTLIELNIADDYFKAKALVEKLEGDMRMRNTYRRLRHTSTTRLQSLMIWMSISIFRAI